MLPECPQGTQDNLVAKHWRREQGLWTPVLICLFSQQIFIESTEDTSQSGVQSGRQVTLLGTLVSSPLKNRKQVPPHPYHKVLRRSMEKKTGQYHGQSVRLYIFFNCGEAYIPQEVVFYICISLT